MLHRSLPRLLRNAVAMLIVATGAPAIAQSNSESQLKAAFLVNFMKYVEWPESKTTATLCLFGRPTAIAANLTALEGRPIAGRELRLRRVTSSEQVGECQLLFIPDTEEARFGAVLRWTEGLPILTVSDSEVFTHSGGAIALVRTEGNLEFDINVGAVNLAGLKPSSQMMRLARKVLGMPR